MRYKHIDYNNKHLKRISLRQVNNIIKHYTKHYDLIIYATPVNMQIDYNIPYLHLFEIEISQYNDYYDYINIINEIIYYNCNNEVGNYLKYYIEVKQ